ncbi:unnamed protein product, partial [Ectocarpus sp. 4 AP-2014]
VDCVSPRPRGRQAYDAITQQQQVGDDTAAQQAWRRSTAQELPTMHNSCWCTRGTCVREESKTTLSCIAESNSTEEEAHELQQAHDHTPVIKHGWMCTRTTTTTTTNNNFKMSSTPTL